MNEQICNQQDRECYIRAHFRKRCHHNLVRLPLHIVFVASPICNQPRHFEMNRTVLILFGLTALVAVGYALPGNYEKRTTTELEAHVLEILSNQVLEELSRSRRTKSSSDSSDSSNDSDDSDDSDSDDDDDDDDCDVVAVIAGLPALTAAAMTCATAALATAPVPPAPIATVEITPLVSCVRLWQILLGPLSLLTHSPASSQAGMSQIGLLFGNSILSPYMITSAVHSHIWY